MRQVCDSLGVKMAHQTTTEQLRKMDGKYAMEIKHDVNHEVNKIS